MTGKDGLSPAVALVGPLPPPYGGMANQTLQLAKLLKKEGWQIHLVRTNLPYSPAWAGRIRGVRALFRLIPFIFNLWRTFGKTEVVHLMANSGWSWHLFAVPAIWVARFRRVPVIVNYRGGEAGSFLEKSEGLIKWSMHRVREIVVPSAYLQDIFRSYRIEARVIPNIIDLSRFTPVEKEAVASAEPHIIVCRNLEAIYDNATALRAFKEILQSFPGARMTLAGEGPERNKLELLAKELDIAEQVSFPGRLNVEGMVDLYRSADLMLNASRVDNMPNALLESMSMGLPFVSTDAGGIPYIVEDEEHGLLVPVGDWQKMADAAIRLLSDGELYRRLSINGQKEVSRYRWSSVKPLWMELYRETAASPAL